MTLSDSVSNGLQALAQLPALQNYPCQHHAEDFERYLQLLQQWNRTFNLTAIRDAEDQVVRHLLDSLVLLPYLEADRIADVGTGAGLPGIPLAIADPRRQWSLIDSNSKKTRFVTQVKLDLNLHQVTVIHDRVETLSTEPFDQIICRAFKPLDQLVDSLSHLLSADGVILAMIGKPPDRQAEAKLSQQGKIALIPLTVPGLNATRFLLTIKPKSRATGVRA